MRFEDALRLLPKVELHCHLEGCMRPATVADLARANDVRLPLTAGAPVTDLYNYNSLTEFLEVFWLVQSVLVTPGDWARLAYEAVVDGAASGRGYAEVFLTPARLLAAGQQLSDIVAGVDEGLAAGEAETGSRTALIIDMDRAFGAAAGRDLVVQVGELRRCGAKGAARIIGIGMDSTEIGVDPKRFAPAYALAKTLGLRRTGHQGEDTPAASIAEVIDVLGAERIDHGLSITEDPELVRRVAGEGIPLTLCPSSNMLIANRMKTLTEHPFPALRSAGVLATLNTDDPALTGLTLAGEYSACAQAWGWSFDTCVDIARAGVEASWLDDTDKRALTATLDASAAELRSELVTV